MQMQAQLGLFQTEKSIAISGNLIIQFLKNSNSNLSVFSKI